MDDLTIASVIKLKENLEKSNNIELPPVFHSRTGHILPQEKNPIQMQLQNLSEFADNNQMIVNKDKTKVMLFNRSRSLDFQPEVVFENSILNVVEETKLLGVLITSDLKWKRHVQNVKKECNSRMWALRRMKEIGATVNDMKEVYKLQIRCKTELACPSWNGYLTKADIDQLEGIQKTALKIILDNKYGDYQNALKILNLSTLEKRREKLCRKFALKSNKSDKFSKWFKRVPRNTRGGSKYVLPKARTAALEKSPLFYLTQFLN